MAQGHSWADGAANGLLGTNMESSSEAINYDSALIQWGEATGDPEQRFMYLASMYLALAMVGFAVTAFFLTFAWLDMVYFIAAMMGGLYVCVARRLG